MVVRSASVTWQLKAACRGPHASIFFPPEGIEHKHQRAERELAAKSICANCAVRQPCLDYALSIEEPLGIWGGLNEYERRRIANQRTG